MKKIIINNENYKKLIEYCRKYDVSPYEFINKLLSSLKDEDIDFLNQEKNDNDDDFWFK